MRAHVMKTALILVVAVFAESGCVYASTTYAMDPKSSFVQADLGNSPPDYLPDQPDNPLIIPVTPGTMITLMAHGGICYAGTDPNGTLTEPCYALGSGHLRSAPEMQAEMGGVFSADTNLLDDSNLPRIPGAINSGLPDYTDPYYTTFYFDRNVSTVNPSDFLIPYLTGVTVIVPAGAHYLFLGVFDSYYKDNTDPSGTLAIEYIGHVTVPEPGTFAMLLAGVAGLLALRRPTSSESNR